MSSQETDTAESATSLSDVSSFDDDFDRMRFESVGFNGEATDDDVGVHAQGEIISQSPMK